MTFSQVILALQGHDPIPLNFFELNPVCNHVSQTGFRCPSRRCRLSLMKPK